MVREESCLLISLGTTVQFPTNSRAEENVSHLESLLVSPEKAVVTAEEALSQAKTVLEEVKLSLATVLTREKSEQPKARE